MTNYGYDFKQLRELKGLSLGALAKEANLSKSTLSRFENGETQLALDKFMSALASIEISLADFEYFQEHQQLPLITEARSQIQPTKEKKAVSSLAINLAKIDSFVSKSDMTGLLTYQLGLAEEEQLLKILCKKYLSDLGLDMLLPEADIQYIRDYFQNKTFKEIAELRIFLLFSDILESGFELSEQVLLNLAKEDFKAVLQFLSDQLEDALAKEDLSRAKQVSHYLTLLVKI
ncbi:helix-turn-helix domain-containing protein [Streptococcus loxodontisalivarius]|uniref:Transcriptional regulator with XRE-family HTH domain n=1 Tax=Streptococcus loxodontisalivarius TaxID=1349415 RepID=A0ABS2PPD1_9STRE|nr:helix-turn-helix transcriptional regulator [Streptococcus loxodontisalivarius]MBM7641892.1 transcriptional regulator with XRE-family HTH domain [Streptococcus loxodontisalivarius]